MATEIHKQHDSRYARKKRGTPGPNSMHAIAEQGEDGIWRVNGHPWKAPRSVRYAGSDGKGDIFLDQQTGERMR